ncbi:ParB/RepB/Spo0J family partition protein [Bradyrhizobium barranii subsp. barranii]
MVMERLVLTLVGIDTPSERLRALQPGGVDALAESMKRNGLLHPITVRKRPGRGYYVIAGAHRLAAARKLKWKTIECIYLKDCNDDTAKLAEIDENLMRAELSPAERAMHVDRRKAIYEAIHGKAKANGANAANKAMGNNATANLADAFTKDTADKTGQSDRSIRRDAARAKQLGDGLKRVTGTSLDKGVELDALAKMKPQERAPIIERAEAGEQVSAVVEKIMREPPKIDMIVEQALRLAAQMTVAERELIIGKLRADAKPVIEPSLRKPPKLSKPDANVIKQAGNFHVELMKYTAEFCASVKSWHAANEIDEESHDCVVQALEMASMRLQQTAQDIDDR